MNTTEELATRDGWMVGALVVAAMALVTAVAGVGLGMRAISESNTTVGAGQRANGVPSSATINLSEFKVEPTVITVSSGGTLHVVNAGATAHNLAVKSTSLTTPMIDAGGSADLALTGLKTGTYTVYCQVPGHEQSGMTAKVKVVAGGREGVAAQPKSSAPPPSSTASAAAMDAAMAKSIKEFPAKTAGVGALPLAPTVLADGTKEFDLTAKIVKWEVAPGKTVNAWTINGTVPGPTLRVDPGDRVRVVLHNELPESTALHFHGIRTPNNMDGVPGITQDPVKPGQTFTYAWTAQSTPAVGCTTRIKTP